MQDIISIHFITILHKTTPSLRPQTPPASKKRIRDDDDDDDCITISKAYYDEIVKLASATLFEACYGRTNSEMMEWIDNMNKKIADAAAESPLTDEQRRRMDIDAIRRDLDYTIPGLFLEIRKLKGDGNQHNRFSSFDYTGKELDDYAGSQLKMMIENDDGEYFSCFKHLKAHVLPMVSGLNLQVAEMRDHIHTYDKSILGAYGKLDRLEKTIASIQDNHKKIQDATAGLKCSLDSVQNQVTRIAAQVASLTTSQTEILQDIKDLQQGEIDSSEQMVRYQKLDALFTTEEEKAANHTMVLCDLTDCKYCDAKNKKDW